MSPKELTMLAALLRTTYKISRSDREALAVVCEKAAKYDARPNRAVDAERDVVEYVVRWGGNCRDCADENGVCPNSGLPCGGARKAIEHVLAALRYGVQHGYVADPLMMPNAKLTGDQRP